MYKTIKFIQNIHLIYTDAPQLTIIQLSVTRNICNINKHHGNLTTGRYAVVINPSPTPQYVICSICMSLFHFHHPTLYLPTFNLITHNCNRGYHGNSFRTRHKTHHR